jgi:hypothetical protein
MAQYLVEAYTSGRGSDGLASLVARLRQAAAAMRRDGVHVRYLRPILVPEDETCFHLLDAPSAAAAGEVSRRADLVHERIVEAAEWSASDSEEELR